MDLVSTTYVVIFLASQRLVKTLEDGGITGWSSLEARLFGKDQQEIPGYRVLTIKGKCGPFDKSRSQHKTLIGAGGKPYEAWVGLGFDTSTWDGSDIFVPGNTGFILMCERVKVLLEKARITNVEFENTREIEILQW